MNTYKRNLRIEIRRGSEVPGWEDYEFIFWAEYFKFCFGGEVRATESRFDTLKVSGMSSLIHIEAEDYFKTIGKGTPPGFRYAHEFDRFIPHDKGALYECIKRSIALFAFYVAWGRYPFSHETLPMNFVNFHEPEQIAA